ncbi:hypothetical protein [Actinophytocola glycyrrhizae]|uniref:Uncharacterized protein n=1 Tax=Actinophytocola glycyrrhizae TaxID=2044873 RepID=A0ABV9S5C5_9PSEU
MHNQAALVTSYYCGLPDLARQWCHHQVRARRAGVRNHGRSVTAVSARTDTDVDGIEIPADLTDSVETPPAASTSAILPAPGIELWHQLYSASAIGRAYVEDFKAGLPDARVTSQCLTNQEPSALSCSHHAPSTEIVTAEAGGVHEVEEQVKDCIPDTNWKRLG